MSQNIMARIESNIKQKKNISTKYSKTSEPHRLRMSLTNKFNLKDPNKDIELVNLSICYTRKHIKSAYNYNKLSDNKISAPT